MTAIVTERRATRASHWILATGGVFMALATICGALGAHALPGRLTPRDLQIYETAVRFQFFQARVCWYWAPSPAADIPRDCTRRRCCW
jgi:hypothetical protein